MHFRSLTGLHLRQVNSGGEVPADLLLFHVLFPFTLPHLHARCRPAPSTLQIVSAPCRLHNAAPHADM